MNFVDLHVHTLASDGAWTASRVIAEALARKVEVLALTDHDTVAAYDAPIVADARSPRANVALLPGIEWSACWQRRGVHIVGLGIDPFDSGLRAACARQRAARETRAEQIGASLARRGVPNAHQGARALAGSAAVGRPHFARYLVDTGAARDLRTAYRRFLGGRHDPTAAAFWPCFSETIAWIHDAGGLAVLAHPTKYGLTGLKLESLAADFHDAGGDAIEIVSGPQDSATTQRVARIARDLDLYGSVGSDFHGPGPAARSLGVSATLPAGIEPVWSRLRDSLLRPAIPAQT